MTPRARVRPQRIPSAASLAFPAKTLLLALAGGSVRKGPLRKAPNDSCLTDLRRGGASVASGSQQEWQPVRFQGGGRS